MGVGDGGGTVRAAVRTSVDVGGENVVKRHGKVRERFIGSGVACVLSAEGRQERGPGEFAEVLIARLTTSASAIAATRSLCSDSKDRAASALISRKGLSAMIHSRLRDEGLVSYKI